MWCLLAPIKAGTRVSSMDVRDSVVDTGTQANETGRTEAVVIELVRSRGLGVRSRPCPTIYGVPASISGVSRFVVSSLSCLSSQLPLCGCCVEGVGKCGVYIGVVVYVHAG